jgi:hypothetical protein
MQSWAMYIAEEGLKRPQHRDHPWSIVLSHGLTLYEQLIRSEIKQVGKKSLVLSYRSAFVFGRWSPSISVESSPVWYFSLLFSVPQGKFGDRTLHRVRFLPKPFQFNSHPTIRCYTVSMLKGALNIPQNKKREVRYGDWNNRRPSASTSMTIVTKELSKFWFNQWTLFSELYTAYGIFDIRDVSEVGYIPPLHTNTGT